MAAQNAFGRAGSNCPPVFIHPRPRLCGKRINRKRKPRLRLDSRFVLS
jgi:hypothetical protein